MYQQSEIKIIKTYRFKGEPNPSDQAIIYLVIANDGTVAYSLDTYGVHTNQADNDGFAGAIHNMPFLNTFKMLIPTIDTV